MKTISLITMAFILTTTSAQAQKRYEHFGDSYQFIFFSVLEGLYQDGATQEDVDRVLMKRDGYGHEHFIGHCPICMSVKLAFQTYASRPHFQDYKPVGYQVNNSTFGEGFPTEVKVGLASKDVKVRLKTIHRLVSKWIDRRMKNMNMTIEQRAALLADIKIGREEGMKMLKRFKNDPVLMKSEAPGYIEVDECASCNAAWQVGFKIIPGLKTNQTTDAMKDITE